MIIIIFLCVYRRNDIIATLIKISINKKKQIMTVNLTLETEAFGTLRYADILGNARLVENPTVTGGTSRIENVREWTSNVNGVVSTGTELDVVAFSDTLGITEVNVDADPKVGQEQGNINFKFNLDVQSEASNVSADFTARPRTSN